MAVDSRFHGVTRVLLRLLILVLCASDSFGNAAVPELEVFVREGCPRCAAAKAFIDRLTEQRPTLHVLYRDVGHDPSMLARLQQLAAEQGLAQAGVPAFYAGGQLLIGYHDEATTGAQLIALLDSASTQAAPDNVNACRIQPRADCTASPAPDEGVAIPWLGRITPQEIGLPLFTLTIGLLDGFNPCAMWVLLFLLSLLMSLRNRFKMVLVAGTFVVVSGLVYFAFMAAWLNLFLLMGLSRSVHIVLGGVAFLIGALNVKDFFAFQHGPTLSIPEGAKPGLFVRLRSIAQAEHLAGALLGVMVLAVLVNGVELLCTAGFPALYTQILTMHQLPAWQYYGYLALYNVAYILDDAVMVTIAVVTLSHRKLAEREGRWLKLISGTVMILLGLVLLVKPDLLV